MDFQTIDNFFNSDWIIVFRLLRVLSWITVNVHEEEIAASACVFILGISFGILWKYCVRNQQNIRRSRAFSFDSPTGRNEIFPQYDSSYLDDDIGTSTIGSPVQRGSYEQQVPIKQIFTGDGEDIWSEFIRYFENVATINGWNEERISMIFFTVLRGQAETYAYGLPMETRANWTMLQRAMDDRFGHHAMKESYIAEVKMGEKKHHETLRGFGQAIQGLKLT